MEKYFNLLQIYVFLLLKYLKKINKNEKTEVKSV
jgi:hypothetical protein